MNKEEYELNGSLIREECYKKLDSLDRHCTSLVNRIERMNEYLDKLQDMSDLFDTSENDRSYGYKHGYDYGYGCDYGYSCNGNSGFSRYSIDVKSNYFRNKYPDYPYPVNQNSSRIGSRYNGKSNSAGWRIEYNKDDVDNYLDYVEHQEYLENLNNDQEEYFEDYLDDEEF